MEDESSSRIFTVVVAVVDELRFKLEEAWGASPADWAISNGESRFTSVLRLKFKATMCWSFFWPRDGGGGRSCRRRRRLASVGLVAKVKHKV